MKKNRRSRWGLSITGLAFFFILTQAQAQTPDTTAKILTLPQYFKMVAAYHPIVRHARLLPEIAQQEIRLARGYFDPSIDVHWNQKELWDYKNNWSPKTYFTNWNNYLKIPAWVGDFKVGYERYVGESVNPENFTPPAGMIYAEAALPLARGLLMDERRAQVLQARRLAGISRAEQVKSINKTLLQASKDYCGWFEAYEKWKLSQKAYDLAAVRAKFVQQNILQGAAPPVDSIEANLELLKREMSLREAKIEYNNAALIAANHLWADAETPLEIKENTFPNQLPFNLPSPSVFQRDTLLKQAAQTHPEITKLSLKLEQYEIEKRWRRNELLPRFDINYKALFIANKTEFTGKYFAENFKVGFDLYMPLFLRKERAKLAATKLKMEQTELELQQTRREVNAFAQAAFNEWENYTQLLRLQEQTVTFAQRLLEAEQAKFAAGESSLFMINSRERSLVAAQEKLIEVQTKWVKAYFYFHWTTGKPMNELFE